MLRYLWASPWTLVGLAIGGLGMLTGGAAQRGPGIIEFHGGAVRWLLERLPGKPYAMTMGHAVWGANREALEHCRCHELVHVRQYERWGILFIPAYLACWLVLTLRGKNGYWDNPFEREAYGEDEKGVGG